MTEAEAIAYVTLHAQTEAYPTVDAADVEVIVRDNLRATVWTAETDYSVGQRVQPTTPNGHFYECVQAGESDETEPDWSCLNGFRFYEFASTLIWRECAIDIDGNLYNLRSSIHAVWSLKTALAAKEFDVSIDNQKWNRAQIYQHCLEMARAYLPID